MIHKSPNNLLFWQNARVHVYITLVFRMFFLLRSFSLVLNGLKYHMFLNKSHVKTYINKLNSKKSCPKTALTKPFMGLPTISRLFNEKIYVPVFVDPGRPVPPVPPPTTPGAQPENPPGPCRRLAQASCWQRKFREKG